MSATEPVSVHILDREYTVGVAPDERSSLMAAAKLLELDRAQEDAAATLGANSWTIFRRVTLPPLVLPLTSGALLQHFLLETILAGDLMGVSPFGQPAVEQGKVLTRQYLAEMKDA